MSKLYFLQNSMHEASRLGIIVLILVIGSAGSLAFAQEASINPDWQRDQKKADFDIVFASKSNGPDGYRISVSTAEEAQYLHVEVIKSRAMEFFDPYIFQSYSYELTGGKIGFNIRDIYSAHWVGEESCVVKVDGNPNEYIIRIESDGSLEIKEFRP